MKRSIAKDRMIGKLLRRPDVDEEFAEHSDVTRDSAISRLAKANEFARSLGAADARVFFGEFHRALNPSATDWDAVAWQLCDLGDYEDLRDQLWPQYQAQLIAVSRIMAAESWPTDSDK